MVHPGERSDEALLREFVEQKSQEAFERLVERHLGLIRAAAGRQVGDPELADDVCQAVFILLARKARSIARPAMLPGWLVRATYFACGDARKIEARRKVHEQRAAAMNMTPQNSASMSAQGADSSLLSPLLDQALARLRQVDRAAVTLRYLEGRSMNEVGAAIGISEAAAAKRVERALKKMRSFFTRHGVTIPQAGLGIAIASVVAKSSAAAPLPLAAYVSGVALGAAHGLLPSVMAGAGGAAASPLSLSIAKGTGHLMLIAKVKTAVAVLSVVTITAGGGTAIVHHIQARESNRAAPVSARDTVAANPAVVLNAKLPDDAQPAAPAGAAGARKAEKSAPQQTTGSNASLEGVSGTIRLEGPPPKMGKIDMSAVPLCHGQHKSEMLEETVIVGDDGGLANVVVSIKRDEGMSLPGDDVAPATPAVLDQQGCQYFPHVVAVQVGQPLLVKNNDPFLHNVHSLPEKNNPMNKAQPNIDRQGAKSAKLGEPEVFRVKCDVHPWMGAWVAVIDNPFFAVTGKDGKFRLPTGLPNGDYTITIWHEKYGTQEGKVTVKDGRGEAHFVVRAK